MTNWMKLLLGASAALALTACGNKEETANTGNGADNQQSEEVSSEAAPMARPELPALDAAALAENIKTLASDDYMGRAPATEGGQKTIAWLMETMANIGLEPANGDSYLQDVPLVEVTVDPAASSFTLNGDDGSSQILSYSDEIMFWTKQVTEETAFDNSDLVFVGHGVVAPEYGWNDYDGMDVTGKTVVMLVNDPGYRMQDSDLFNGKAMTYYGRWTYKFEEAARQGAAAALVIHQTAPAAYGWGVVSGSWSGPQLDLQRPDNGAGRTKLEGWITEDVARNLFKQAGLDFDEMEQESLSADFSPVKMGGLTASGTIKNVIKRSASQNVAGKIIGSKYPDEYVLYMAHWDHLGNSGEGEDHIYNGAVDNATGTAGILSIAESFANAQNPPERSILFLAVTAEESGLLGSAYFAEDPFVPLKNIIGGINIDAILPAGSAKDIMVVGFGASELEDLLETQAKKRDRYLRPDAEPEKGYFYRSDHISLAKKGVPMLYADSGIDLIEGGEEAGRAFAEGYTTERYHKPADEYSDDWDISGIVSTLEILRDVGADMAYSDIRPNWYEGNEFRALRDAM
jgi:Zn-dependent M28 family amino/carboxypeptidase